MADPRLFQIEGSMIGNISAGVPRAEFPLAVGRVTRSMSWGARRGPAGQPKADIEAKTRAREQGGTISTASRPEGFAQVHDNPIVSSVNQQSARISTSPRLAASGLHLVRAVFSII